MPRRSQERCEHRLFELVPVTFERRHQPAVGLRVLAELGRRRIDGALERDRCAVVEGVRDHRGRLDHLDAVFRQRQRAEVRRARDERVDGGAHVVDEARQGQLGGAHSPAERVLRLADEHRPTRAGQRDRGGEPVRARPDHDGVVSGQAGDLADSGAREKRARQGRREPAYQAVRGRPRTPPGEVFAAAPGLEGIAGLTTS